MKLLYIIFSSKKKKNSISTLLPNAMTTFFYYLTLHSQRNRHTTHTHTPVFCSISRGSLARVKFLPTTTNYYTCIPWLLETRCRCSSEYSKLRSVEKVHYQTFFYKKIMEYLGMPKSDSSYKSEERMVKYGFFTIFLYEIQEQISFTNFCERQECK